MTIEVRVLLYGAFATVLGRRHIDVELTAGSRVVDLLAGLGRQFPALEQFLPTDSDEPGDHLVVMIGLETASLSDQVKAGAEIRLLPPMSGGAMNRFP